jgi:uncharacterized protein YukE
MKLTEDFWNMCERFVEYIHHESGASAIVCDDQGIITRAYVKTRIGQVHAGAKKIMAGQCSEYAVTAEEAAANPLVREGMNVPIVVDGEKLAALGIAASLEVAKPVAKITALVMSSWIKRSRQRELLQETASGVVKDMRDLTQKLEAAVRRLAEVQGSTAQAAAQAEDSVKATDRIMSDANRISQRTEILSLNSSIEAARLGIEGRAFAAMAKEMASLSKSTQEAMEVVQNTMNAVRTAVHSVSSAVQDSAAIFQENLQMIGGVTALAEALATSLAKLEAVFREQD